MISVEKVKKLVKLDSVYTPPVANVESKDAYYVAAVKRKLDEPYFKNQLPCDIWDPIISNIGATAEEFEIMGSSDYIELNEKSRPMMSAIAASGNELKIITIDKEAYDILLKSLRDLVSIILDAIHKVEEEDHVFASNMEKARIVVELLTSTSSGIELESK